MHETTKAMRRRWIEDASGGYKWRRLFQGQGIDVGAGDDPVALEGCRPFDMRDGDANCLSSYFKAGAFDWLHASQCLEHMCQPKEALADWGKVVRRGGHLIVTVPSWELYEGMVWPSRWNPDHKSTWSLWQTGSPAPCHVHVPSFLQAFAGAMDTRLCRLVDTHYNYSVGPSVDQTLNPMDEVECWIEFVLQRL